MCRRLHSDFHKNGLFTFQFLHWIHETFKEYNSIQLFNVSYQSKQFHVKKTTGKTDELSYTLELLNKRLAQMVRISEYLLMG